MMFPSLNNENPLTWRCKVFGCKDEELQGCIVHEAGEMHGIRNFGRYTAVQTFTEITFSGCMWCKNFRRVVGEEKQVFPVWECSCPVCDPDLMRDNRAPVNNKMSIK